MDELGDLRAFVRTVEAGGIERAAGQLGIAKSAVSRRLKELEAGLGAALFRKQGRKLVLTARGQAFHARVSRILADLEEARQEAASDAQDLKGILRVAAPVTFATMHLSDALTAFALRHPGLVFDIDMNDRQVDLAAENIDVALRIGRLDQGELIARRLARIRHAVVASPAYLERHGIPRRPDDLATHRALVYAGHSEREVWPWRATDGRSGSVTVPTAMRASNGEFLRDAAIAGLGIVREPTFILHEAVEQGRLVPLLTDYSWSNIHAHAVYPPTRHLARRVRVFIDFLVEHFAGEPYWDRPFGYAKSERA